jgi:thiosulfate dehydrogenase
MKQGMPEQEFRKLVRSIGWLGVYLLGAVSALFLGLYIFMNQKPTPSITAPTIPTQTAAISIAERIAQSGDAQLQDGYAFFVHTDETLGPHQENPERRITGNGLKCSSCHLNEGTQPFGLPLNGVSQRFPQYRGREDKIGTLAERVNGCFARSMNGKTLDTAQYEMKAIISYIDWLDLNQAGTEAQKVKGLKPIELPNRAVDMAHGKEVYDRACALCHQGNGLGLKNQGAISYTYPPLWGPDAYNNGAGMSRVITAAQFIKNNMPFGINYENPILTDEEAYDVAGYINQQPRPQKSNLEKDFPNLVKKPVSTPYPPYLDPFPQSQHQMGPYPEIIAYYAKQYQEEKKN